MLKTRTHPGLLVSVRNAAEAAQALQGGATWIDVKEPDQGALGQASWEQIRAVVAQVAGRAPTSCALGELLAWQSTWPRQTLGVELVKFGLAGCGELADWPSRWQATASQLPVDVGTVGVIYADWPAAQAPPPDEVLAVANSLEFSAILIDTFDKRQGSLLDLWNLDQLQEVVAQIRATGRPAIVAGSLSLETIPPVLTTAATMIAVRTAACRDGRSGKVDARCVQPLATMLGIPGRTTKSSLLKSQRPIVARETEKD